MSDWFRNSQWNEEIAATFEARLSRARQKAEYLNIQGYSLLATQPAVAAELLRRAIALDNPGQTARACLYLGTALAVAGDLDGAIAALEGAIEAEQRHPMHRTAAYLDQALLIALAQRSDLYDLALKRIDSEQDPAVRRSTSFGANRTGADRGRTWRRCWVNGCGSINGSGQVWRT